MIAPVEHPAAPHVKRAERRILGAPDRVRRRRGGARRQGFDRIFGP